MAIGAGNPKAILFHASLMPLLIGVSALTLFEAIGVLAIVFVVDVATMGAYAMLSGGVSRWLRRPMRMVWLNRVAGTAMVGTGLAIASR